jgi:hypothetical protein
MRDEMFADPWLDARPGPGGAEPEFGLRTEPRPPDPHSGTENLARKGLSSPPDPLPSRALTTSAALPVGSLLYFALVGHRCRNYRYLLWRRLFVARAFREGNCR